MEKQKSFADDISKILVKRGAFSQKDLPAINQAFHDSDKDQFDDFLLEEGLVGEADLLDALSDYYQVPSFDTVGYFFETALLHEFPKDILLRHGMIPLEVEEESILIMIASDPSDQDLLMVIGEYVSYDVQFKVGLKRDICDAIKEFYEPSLTEESANDLYDDVEETDEIERVLLQEAEILDEEFIRYTQDDDSE